MVFNPVREEGLLKQAQRLGRDIPESIKNAPQLHQGLEFYYKAFFDLLASLVNHSISWAIVQSYGEHFELQEEELEELHFFTPVLLAEYLKLADKK